MKVLIADKFEDVGVDRLKEIGCEVKIDPALKDEVLREAITALDPRALIVRSTQVTAPMIEAGKNLALIIRAGSGYNTIDCETARKRNVAVANCPGMNSVAVAELALGLMIALDRRIPDNVIALREGQWAKKEFSSTAKARGLKGRTLGIVGLGIIGREVAQRAAAFEMNIIYADIVRNAEFEQRYGLRHVELDDLLRQADFVSVHVPLTADTKHLLDAGKLALMKPTACLINTSRGDVVDNQALQEALQSGKLARAALDVYENEPAATDPSFGAPIAKVDNLYGTHHIAASTEQAQLAVAEEAVRIVENFLKTGTVINCVN